MLFINQLKTYFFKEHVFVFFFSLAILFGASISILFAFDLSQFPDCEAYLGIAKFDFEQSELRRFRILIPFSAFVLQTLFGPLFNKLSPSYFVGDFSLAFSFFIVNILLMSAFGLFIYRYCKAYNISKTASLIGLLCLLTSRYTFYFSALPLVDSLFCLIIAATLLGIKQKNSRLIILSILIGPWAKEAFIFIAPIIFFYSHLPKLKLFFYFLISGLLIFSFHFLLDYFYPPREITWLKADLYLIQSIPHNLKLLFSFYGIYKVCINLGFWLIPLLYLFINTSLRTSILKKLENYMYAFLVSVLFQIIISDAIERMFYIAMPVVCLLIAFLVDEIKNKINWNKNLIDTSF